jgi:protein gp37
MGATTSIEWAANADGTPGATWNPIRAQYTVPGDIARIGTHCVHVSEGCRNCYAERMNMRMLPGNGTGLPYAKQSEAKLRIFLDERMLAIPLRRRKPTTYFLSSMSDVFADFVTDDMLDRLFAVMALSPQHTFIVLTKRAERMRAYCSTLGGHHERDRVSLAMKALDAELSLSGKGAWYTLRDGGAFFPNICLGVSVEDQPTADERIPHLLATPARWRAVSAEPLLARVDLEFIPANYPEAPRGRLKPGVYNALSGEWWPAIGDAEEESRTRERDLPRVDWLICGGESGPNARPMHPDWARSLRDQCAAAGVPYFMKQWGEWKPGELDRETTILGGAPAYHMLRVGKARAGRLLDGVAHNARPDFFSQQGEALATRVASPGRAQPNG